MLKRNLLLVVFLAAILALTSCSNNTTSPGEADAGANTSGNPSSTSTVETYVLSLGGTTGTFYQLGTAVADFVNNNYADSMKLLPSTSAGGIENARNIFNGDAAFGPVFPKDLVNAYTGKGYDKPFDKLRYVGIAQQPNACAFVVLADSGIETFYDLEGKTVAPGAPGSSAYDMFVEFAQFIGIYDKIKIVNIGSQEIPGKLADGEIDCFAVMTMADTAASRISEVSTTKPIHIIDMKDIIAETKFLDSAGWYSTTELPGGQYKGQDTPVTCFSSYPVWATSSDVPDEVVYNFLEYTHTDKAIAHLESIIAGHGHDVEDQLNKVFPIPLHPGAQKWWSEHGYTTFPEPMAK